MSWDDELKAISQRATGFVQAREAPHADYGGYLPGFVDSTLSAVGEFVGAKPTAEADAFRQDNPISGVVSSMLPGLGAYGAAFKLSKLPRAAEALEGATARVLSAGRTTIADSPVLAGITRETLRYAPLEASRLAIGAGVVDNLDDYGDLFSDVAVSTAFNGGLGTIAGLIEKAGPAARRAGRVVQADFEAVPFAEYRAGLKEGASTSGDLDVATRMQQLRDEIDSGEIPDKSLKRRTGSAYSRDYEGATTPGENAQLSSLFNVSRDENREGALIKKVMEEGPETSARTLNPEEKNEVMGGLGVDSDTFYSNVRNPRVIDVATERGAASLRGIIGTPAMQEVAPGTFIAKEKGGLFTVVKRLKAGEVPPEVPLAEGKNPPREGTKLAKKAHIKRQVNAGDRYFVTRTDNPGIFAPEAKKLSDAVVEDWARFREPYRDQGEDVFNQNANLINRAITHQDYGALVGTGKRAWTGRVLSSLGDKIAGAAGLKDSEAVRRVVDNIYDTFKPTLELEKNDTMFGRLFGHLKANQGLAEEHVNRIMQEVDPILNDLSDDERNLVYRASMTQTPAVDAPKLLANENPSPKVVEAIQKLQSINANFIGDVVLPAFKSAKMLSEFKPLEGYIMPRIYKGSLRSLIRNEKGRPAFLASGNNHHEVRREIQAVLDEAASRGHTYTFEDPHHVVETSTDQLERITGYVSNELAKGGESADIVRSAMKRLDVAKFDNQRMGLNKRPPGSFKERTGMEGSPDLVTPDKFSAKAMSEAIKGNLKQLSKYAGYLTWRERFASEALSLGASNPTLYASLMRKANQFMGIEGQITNVLNRTLQPVLGPILGSKPATKIAQATNAVMYDWNLGFVNPTFALLNYLSPLQTVTPWVAMMTRAPSEYVARTAQFVHGVDSAGKVIGGMGVLSPLKVLANSIREMKNPGEALAAAYERARLDGTLSARLFEGHDSEAAQSFKEAYQKNGWLGFTHFTSRFLGVHSEQFSRSVAFATAHAVGRDHFGLEGDALYRFAKRGTETTMYQYAVTDRARIITGPIGSVFGLFKNWQMHFIGSMAEYAGLALNEGVWSPLLWQSASALALGGLGATPLKLLADGLARNYSDDPTGLAWLHHKFSPEAADAIYFGLPSFLGVSLQSSAMMPGTDTQQDLQMLTTAVAWERAKAIGKAMQSASAAEQATGQSGYRDPKVRDQMLQAISPRFLFRAVASVEGEAIKSMRTGTPIVQNPSFLDKLEYGLGFNTTKVDAKYAIGKALRDRDEQKLTLVKGYGEAFMQAQAAGDLDEMTRLLKRATSEGIGTDQVVKSALARHKRDAGDYLSKWKAQDVQTYGGTLAEGE